MKRIDMVSLLRLCCTLSIVLCHIFQFYGNELAWWLNIGVQIFLLISGFLYGSRTISNGITFLLQNFKKILIDYYIVVLCLIPVYIGWTDVCLSPEYLLRLLLGLGGVPGLEHTWFISTILLCYCVTPLLQKIRTLPRTRFTILLALCVLIEVVCHALPDITGAWINCYILGYCLGFLPAKQPVVLYRRLFFFILPGAILLNAVRIYVSYIHTAPLPIGFRLLYTACSPYIRISLALCLFLLFMLFSQTYFQNRCLKQILSLSDRYSYDVYLTHHVVILGPLSLLQRYSFPLAGILILLFIVLSTALLRTASDRLSSILLRLSYSD